jgi:hypothetical protein
MLYFTFMISKLRYASAAWNSDMIADSNKFASLCHSGLIQDMECHYGDLLERLHLLTLRNSRLHFDTLFLINVLVALGAAPLPSKEAAAFGLADSYTEHW